MMFFMNVKLQISCLVIILYIILNYFLTKRVKSYVHRIFSATIITALIYLLFDLITVYTVNHREMISPILNRILHNIYLTSMTFFLLLVFVYSYSVVIDMKPSAHRVRFLWGIPWIAMAIAIWCLPLHYVHGEHTDYSMGAAAYVAYVCVVFYFLCALFVLLRNRKKVNVQVKRLLFIAYGTQFIILIIQALYPETLVSSMAIAINSIAIYMTLESPDIHLIEQLKIEKQSAISANRAKSEFLAKMSHEIRTPINGVMGLSELIMRESSQDEVCQYGQDIKESAELLLNIINEILDASKIESGKLQIVPAVYEMNHMIRELHSIIVEEARKKELRISFQMDSDIPGRLYGDDLRIKQVLLNLLNNAVKYTLEGEVSLKIECVKKGKDEVELHFAVSDTGIGIKPEHISKLFDSFERIEDEQTRYEPGTGLGLTIASSYLKLMNSELKVKSTYGVGSTFSFTLKQQIVNDQYQQEKPETNAYNKWYKAVSARILVVDDNRLNLKVFTGLLKQAQMNVTAVDNAKEGLDYFKKESFDLIFLDHMMPDMNGIEMLHEMKRYGPGPNESTPVIMLSANAVNGAKEKYLEEGFTDYLSKPILPDKLDEMILKHLPKDLIEYQE